MDGSSPCGMVKVTLTGQQMPVSCEISEEAMAEGSKAVSEKARRRLHRVATSLAHQALRHPDLVLDAHGQYGAALGRPT